MNRLPKMWSGNNLNNFFKTDMTDVAFLKAMDQTKAYMLLL